MAQLRSIEPAETVDVQGRACPYPIILIKKEMEKLPAGAVLKILCDSVSTVEEAVPRYCEKRGYLFESFKIEENYWEIYVQKS